MGEIKNLVGCRALIRDVNTGRLIADTSVAAHNTAKNFITVNLHEETIREVDKVSVLIFTPKQLLEYYGTLRHDMTRFGITISIYGEREKQDRQFPRYEINSQGVVDALIFNEKMVELMRPIKVNVKNISANGLLIQADTCDFYCGQYIRITINLQGTKFNQIYEIIRVQNRNIVSAEFGCKLTKVNVQKNVLPNDFVKADEFGYDIKQAEYEKETGFEDLVYQVSRFRTLIETSTQKLKIKQFDELGDKYEKAFCDIHDNIISLYLDINPQFVANCCSSKKEEVVAHDKDILNATFIAMIMYDSICTKTKDFQDLIKIALTDDIFDEKSEDEKLVNLIEAAKIYVSRASTGTGTGIIPLTTLEQMYTAGKNEPEGSVRYYERLMGEFFINKMRGQIVWLSDGSKAMVLHVPANDVKHPILLRNGFIWQTIDTNPMVGFVVEKT